VSRTSAEVRNGPLGAILERPAPVSFAAHIDGPRLGSHHRWPRGRPLLGPL